MASGTFAGERPRVGWRRARDTPERRIRPSLCGKPQDTFGHINRLYNGYLRDCLNVGQGCGVRSFDSRADGRPERSRANRLNGAKLGRNSSPAALKALKLELADGYSVCAVSRFISVVCGDIIAAATRKKRKALALAGALILHHSGLKRILGPEPSALATSAPPLATDGVSRLLWAGRLSGSEPTTRAASR